VLSAVEQVAGPEAAQRTATPDRIGERPGRDWNLGHDQGQYESAGAYYPGRERSGVFPLIAVALADNPDAVRAAYHEGWHAIEGTLTKTEVAILRRETPRLRKSVMAQSPDLADATGKAEAEEVWAEAAANHAIAQANGEFVGGIHIAVRRIFAKIMRMLARIRNAVAGVGFRTSEDIFESFARGEMAVRRRALPADMRTRWWAEGGEAQSSVRRRTSGEGSERAQEGERGSEDAPRTENKPGHEAGSSAQERAQGHHQDLGFGHDDEIVAPAPAGQQTVARGQGVLPSVEKVGDSDFAQRRADRSLRARRKQKPTDEGLLGERDKPPDRLDTTKKPTEPRPAGGVFDSGSARADSFRPSSSPQHTRAIPRAASEPVATFRNVWQPKRHPDYAAANAGDSDAAVRVVRDLVNGENIAAAREKFGTDVTYVPVSAAGARGTNAVPGALASYYAHKAGGRHETDIRRVNRAYQTGASAMARLAHRAIFRGPVTPGARYVLVDNVSVLGSTLADLADHIQRGGGEVAGAIVFVNAGRTSTLTPTKASVHDIKRRFGNAIEDLFGIAPEGLTAGEAGYLRNFGDAQSLRDRANASQVKRAAQRRAREAGEENDPPNLVDPLGNSVAASLRIPSEISGVTNDLTTNSGLFLQRAEPHIAGSGPSAPAFGGGSAGSAAARKVASEGIVYLRTDVTGKLAPYVGQAMNNKRYIARQIEHAKAFPKSEFSFDIVDTADPGVQLDIAEHNFIQALTGGVRAMRSQSVSNDKDPIGLRRQRAFGLPKAR
jgi:hypothetical protein